MNEQHLFTCKECGSHEVLVSGLYKIVEEHTKELPCECGKALDGIAAYRSYTLEKHFEDYGFLDQEHRWEFINKNNLIEREEIDKEFRINCSKCFITYDLDRKRWKSDLESVELMEGSVEFSVNCGGCGREMEFGWSYPDRTGRIWPVECADFNPEQVWPEPRFHERWRRKGWTRTTMMFDIFRSETRFSQFLRKFRLKKLHSQVAY